MFAFKADWNTYYTFHKDALSVFYVWLHYVLSGYCIGFPKRRLCHPTEPVSGHESMMNLSITKLYIPAREFPSPCALPSETPCHHDKAVYLASPNPAASTRPFAGFNLIQLCWALNSTGWILGMRLEMGVWNLPRSIFGYSPFCWLCESSVVILHVNGDLLCLKWIRVMCLGFVGL